MFHKTFLIVVSHDNQETVIEDYDIVLGKLQELKTEVFAKYNIKIKLVEDVDAH